MLRRALRVMESEIDRGLPGFEGDRLFHLGVAKASHNPVLLQLMEGIGEALDRTSSRSLSTPSQPASSLRDHREILSAIRAHEPTDAADAMLSHLVRTTDALLAMRKDRRVDTGRS
ncbi:FCD domain-containing protein [Saccharopolyspora shandongensis]|uniref:FadR/GntR family transcriptional regulator n=1 Tax=Saccharopolyspora shandongensis TaxID=418495 RepID=UPI0033C66D45